MSIENLLYIEGVITNRSIAECVDPSSLECDSLCAPACPVNPVVDICERGAVEKIDCSSFNLCMGERWVTKYCNDGLVMAAPDKGSFKSNNALVRFLIFSSMRSAKEPALWRRMRCGLLHFWRDHSS